MSGWSISPKSSAQSNTQPKPAMWIILTLNLVLLAMLLWQRRHARRRCGLAYRTGYRLGAQAASLQIVASIRERAAEIERVASIPKSNS